MQHEHHVEKHGFFMREILAAAKHLQHRFGGRHIVVGLRYGGGQLTLGFGDARHVSESGNAGETGEHRHGDVDLVLGADLVGIGIEAVQQEHGARERVHDGVAGRGHGELMQVVT